MKMHNCICMNDDENAWFTYHKLTKCNLTSKENFANLEATKNKNLQTRIELHFTKNSPVSKQQQPSRSMILPFSFSLFFTTKMRSVFNFSNSSCSLNANSTLSMKPPMTALVKTTSVERRNVAEQRTKSEEPSLTFTPARYGSVGRDEGFRFPTRNWRSQLREQQLADNRYNALHYSKIFN